LTNKLYYDRLHMITSLHQFFDSQVYKEHKTFCGRTKDDLIYCSEVELILIYEKMIELMNYIEIRSIWNLKGFGK
jgi:hypothetical protein